MAKRPTLRTLYYGCIAIVVLLVGYQIYLNATGPRYMSLHTAQVAAIESELASTETFEFAVVGNVNNSVNIFQNQIIPLINNSGASFTVSAGNAVSIGAAENYRSVFEIFSNLAHPWLLTYGNNENTDLGQFTFYDGFGPFFYSFRAANAHFIFLDNTDNTDYNWQLRWLLSELQNSTAEHRFVFVSAPLHAPLADTPAFQADRYFDHGPVIDELKSMFVEFNVDIVFSSQVSVFRDQVEDGVRYITTGGAGGVIVDDATSFHHYVRVMVDGEELSAEAVRLDVMESSWLKTLDSLWAAIYAFFYISFARFLIIVSILILLAIKLHELVFEPKDYYRKYSIDASAWRGRKKKVLFFTNNFFPFISGVTISIDRLLRGLHSQGHDTRIVAPDYDDSKHAREDTLRVPTLLAFGDNREFRLANIFQWRIVRFFRQHKPDIVHVHHPFWLGSAGLWLARRYRVPAVYTYHTRLEMYAHYVPLPGRLFRNIISHELVRRFCNKCDGVIVPTVSTEEYLRLIGVKVPLYVQPTGIDYQRFNVRDAGQVSALRQRWQVSKEQLVLISVSRLGKEKNIGFMLEAMARLRGECKRDVRLFIVGEGNERRVLEEQIHTLQLADCVTLVGSVAPDEIAFYYQMADIFVFASKSETQGMVILEAMAAGLPVVAVRSTGTDDVIKNGLTGFKTLERIDEWNRALLTLINNDARRDELSVNAEQFAADYDTAAFATHIDAFYSELLTLRDHQA